MDKYVLIIYYLIYYSKFILNRNFGTKHRFCIKLE